MCHQIGLANHWNQNSHESLTQTAGSYGGASLQTQPLHISSTIKSALSLVLFGMLFVQKFSVGLSTAVKDRPEAPGSLTCRDVCVRFCVGCLLESRLFPLDVFLSEHVFSFALSSDWTTLGNGAEHCPPAAPYPVSLQN